jgi:methionyl-tRNA synthetase
VIADVVKRVDELMGRVSLSHALAAIWEIVSRANGYLVEREPWKVAGDPARRDELGGVLYASAETLRVLAVLIQPIMPGAAQRLWAQLGIEQSLSAQHLPAAVEWGGLVPGTQTSRGDALFPRLED